MTTTTPIPTSKLNPKPLHSHTPPSQRVPSFSPLQMERSQAISRLLGLNTNVNPEPGPNVALKNLKQHLRIHSSLPPQLFCRRSAPPRVNFSSPDKQQQPPHCRPLQMPFRAANLLKKARAALCRLRSQLLLMLLLIPSLMLLLILPPLLLKSCQHHRLNYHHPLPLPKCRPSNLRLNNTWPRLWRRHPVSRRTRRQGRKMAGRAAGGSCKCPRRCVW